MYTINDSGFFLLSKWTGYQFFSGKRDAKGMSTLRMQRAAHVIVFEYKKRYMPCENALERSTSGLRGEGTGKGAGGKVESVQRKTIWDAI